ncbi:MAG: hypothetical protein LBT09_03490 [Planctomycetaceae bacterium]|jgi:hypothetical protein|nr:hypothetical protein [Planctomycetaceae bacterium]
MGADIPLKYYEIPSKNKIHNYVYLMSGENKRSIFRRLFRRRWGEPLVFAVIFAVGLVFFLIHIKSWVVPQLMLMQEFVQTRGVVLETRVLERQVDGKKMYSPEVLLQFDVPDNKKNGANNKDNENDKDNKKITYKIWTFNEKHLYSGGDFSYTEDAAKKLINTYKTGEEIDCWYRVSDPSFVVVYRRVSYGGWFFLLLLFSLLLVGLFGFCFSFRLQPVSTEHLAVLETVAVNSPLSTLTGDVRSTAWSTVPDIKIVNESPGTHLAFRLPLGNQPIFSLVGLTLFTIAWVIVALAIMVHSVISPALELYDRIGGMILRSIFLGVGFFLLFIVVRKYILTFGAGLMLLEISDHPIYSGRRYRLLLVVSGVLQFHELSVAIICEEIARFTQGTDTATNRRIVFKQIIFRKTDFDTSTDAPLNEEFFIQLPMGAMHSFRQENNEIGWKINITARIAGWQEVQRECPIVVRPIIMSDTTPEDLNSTIIAKLSRK